MQEKDLRVLVVDDYEVMTRAVMTQLDILGIENVAECYNGADALKELRNGTFDLVITDWNMEPVSGTELLSNIRNDDALRHIPVIVISAEKRPDIVRESKDAGASNYLIKPFNADALMEKIQKVLA